MLQAKGSEIQWGGDFGGTDETLLSRRIRPARHGAPLSHRVKAFYMQPDPERPEVALGVDVLAPEGYGEIIGGGQRIHDLDLLLQRIEEHDLPQEAFDWYLDLRKYGSVPHGGFGMGVERCVAWICGLEHVRETIAFPRMLYRTEALEVRRRSLGRAGSVRLTVRRQFGIMRHTTIAIIGAPLDLGAGRRGVDMGPSALRVASLNERLAALGYKVEDLRQHAGRAARERRRRATRARAICRRSPHTCRRLARHGREGARRRADCRWCWAAITPSRSGTMSGVSQHFAGEEAALGLIWIDAHADMNTPETSPSGNVHGMPLACVHRHGARAELTRPLRLRAESGPAQRGAGRHPRRRSRSRSRTCKNSGVRAFTMRDIDERGMRAVMEEAIQIAVRRHGGLPRLVRHGLRRPARRARRRHAGPRRHQLPRGAPGDGDDRRFPADASRSKSSR